MLGVGEREPSKGVRFMWEITYLNFKDQEVIVVVGTNSERVAAQLAMKSDKSFLRLISTRNCTGELWYIRQGVILAKKDVPK